MEIRWININIKIKQIVNNTIKNKIKISNNLIILKMMDYLITLKEKKEMRLKLYNKKINTKIIS